MTHNMISSYIVSYLTIDFYYYRKFDLKIVDKIIIPPQFIRFEYHHPHHHKLAFIPTCIEKNQNLSTTSTGLIASKNLQFSYVRTQTLNTLNC
jgi:hypothetical protein